MAIENSINAEIVTILEGLAGVAEVSNYEKSSFRKFPAATVTGSENESDFEATQERQRIYAFSVKLYLEILSDAQGGSGDGLKEGDIILRELSDTVIDEFDKPANARFSGDANTTAEQVLFTEPIPSAWGWDTERNMRMKEVIIRVHTHLNTALL